MRTVRLLAVGLILASGALGGHEVRAQQPDAGAVTTPTAQVAIDKVQAFYDKKSSHGHVIFSKPGKMHWAYDDPAGNHVVSDGTTLKVYEASNNQMFEQAVDKSQYPAALSFLTGQGKL